MRSIYNFFCTYQAILHCLQLFFKQTFSSSQGGVSDKFKRNFTHYAFRLCNICCCSAYLSSCHRTASDANLLDNPHTFHYQDYFVIGEIRTCLGVSDDPMFLWISSNSCPLNLLLVRSHQAEIIIVKRLIQGRNSVTRVRVEPRSFDLSRRKNDAFTHSATLPTTHQHLVMHASTAS